MDRRDRQSITHNLEKLVLQANLDSLLTKLLVKGVFSQRMLEKYQQDSWTVTRRKQELFMDIQMRGPEAYGKLVEALIETGHFDLARILQPSVNIREYLESQSSNREDTLLVGESSQRRERIWTLPQYMVNEENHLQARLQTLVQEHPTSNVNMSTQPLQVVVKQASQRLDKPTHNGVPVYIMGSCPKGYLFMINNVQYVNNIKDERKGAEVDERNMIDLFTGLGYKIKNLRDQGLEDMKRKIQEFSKLPEHSHVDSCVVAILSHGGEGADSRESVIIASDGGQLPITWVVDCFSNQNCPNLRGKPKIFIFQACRGELRDFGVKKVAGRIQRDGISETVLRSHADVLIAYSTVPGFTSIRDVYLGTWFIQFICKVFMKHAHDTDIEDMLKIVDMEVGRLIAEDGVLQTTSYNNNAFHKFYFNPGLYNDMTMVDRQLPPPDGPQG